MSKDQLLAPNDSESTEGTSDSEANGDVKKDKENNLYPDSFRNLPDNLKNKDVWHPDEENLQSMCTHIEKLCTLHACVYICYRSKFIVR